MSKMKRGVLVTLDYPPERGGVARYLGNLVRASEGAIEEVLVPEEHATDGPGTVHAERFFWPLWPQWLPLVQVFRRLGTRSDRVAIVTQVLPVGTAAWLASWVGGVPYSILLHGLDLRLAKRSPQKRWLLRRILRRAEAIFVNSDFVAKEVHDVDARFAPVMILPGVEPIPFPSKDAARARFMIPAETFQLIAVARLVPRKGIDRLLEAMMTLSSDIRLTIVGAGSDESRLRELAKPLGDRVRFETTTSDEERNAWYAAADAFVLPTRDEGRDVEGFGIVFLEAALARLPVIAGQGGGVDEAVLDGETGILVNPNLPQQIATAIQRLKDDRVLATRLGQYGYERALRDFRWEDRAAILIKTLGL